MLSIDASSLFLKDVKKMEAQGKRMELLSEAIDMLLKEVKIPVQFRDHSLSGRRDIANFISAPIGFSFIKLNTLCSGWQEPEVIRNCFPRLKGNFFLLLIFFSSVEIHWSAPIWSAHR